MGSIPHEVEPALRASANAADRANRPRMLVVVPGLLLVVSLLLTIAFAARFAEAKAQLRRQLDDLADVERLVEATLEVRAKTPEVGDLYPPIPRLDDDIDREARRVWRDGSGGVQVGDRRERPVDLISGGDLIRVSVECNVRNVTFEDLSRWITAVLDDPTRSRVFLSHLTLQPTPVGWSGEVEFRVYEKAR